MTLAAILISGCEKPSKPPAQRGAPTTSASLTLSVAVAEDSPLADAITRLRGEWAELGGGELKVINAGADPLAEDFPAADLIVFPSRKLGELCEAGYLRPVRESALESEELAFGDLFPLVRDREIVFGKRVMALPLGCPTPLLAFAPPSPDAPAPTLWSDLPKNMPHHALGTLSEEHQWACLFLARAASYGMHPSREGLLFDPKSLRPRLDEPPFERAMREMQAMASKAPLVGDRITTANTLLGPGRRETIFWPVRDKNRIYTDLGDEAKVAEQQAQLNAAAENFVVSPLPGSGEVFSPVSAQWETLESPQRVTLVATSGQVIGVTASSRNAASAFRLAAWLAGPQNSRQLASATSAAANPRESLARLGDDLTGIGDRRLGLVCSQAHAHAMRSRSALVVPRLVRIDDYLNALGIAVKQAASKSISATEALRQATQEWESLTEAVGRERQAAAYRRHLGLQEYEPPGR